MTQVVIIGAGGHGREVAEILGHQAQAGADVQVVGFIDENQSLRGHTSMACRYWGLGMVRRDRSYGSGRDLRHRAATGGPAPDQKARARGLSFVNAISPLAHISPAAKMGWGIAVFPQVVISTGVLLHSYCILNVGVTVIHGARIGKYGNINRASGR